MPADTPLSEQVAQELRKQLPHLVHVERYLTASIMVWTLLGAAGLLTLGGWGAKIIWEEMENQRVAAAVERNLASDHGPMTRLTNMTTHLHETFRNQVDSASFKVLRFGCTAAGAGAAADFPPCRNEADPAQQFKALEEQTIPFVANLRQQNVRLELSIYPIDVDALEPLLLEIYLEPTSVRPTAAKPARTLIALQPAHVSSNSDFLQHGRLNVANGSQILEATIDLTSFMQERMGEKTGNTHQLRLRPVIEQDNQFKPASGTERFYVRTIIFTHHRIQGVQPAKVAQK